jgi:hypothetical protein
VTAELDTAAPAGGQADDDDAHAAAIGSTLRIGSGRDPAQ